MAEGAPTVRKAMYAIQHGELIGQGSYRKVFRTSRGKWVYKVNISPSIDIGSNAHEWKTYQRFVNVELPKRVRLPEMHYLNGGIIAAEYINGITPENTCYRDYHDETCPGINKCFAEVVKDIDISDIACDNVVIKDGIIYLIDLGLGTSTYRDIK